MKKKKESAITFYLKYFDVLTDSNGSYRYTLDQASEALTLTSEQRGLILDMLWTRQAASI